MARNDELPEDIDDDEPDAPSRLRSVIKRQEAKLRTQSNLEREVAMLKAGVDTTTRKGKAFMATYEGDLDDLEALQADAKDFDPAILRVAQSQSASSEGAPPAEGATTTTTPTEPTGTAVRTALADGAIPADAAKGDPRQESMEAARKALKEGRAQDVSLGEMIAMRARAVANGDLAALGADGRPVVQ